MRSYINKIKVYFLLTTLAFISAGVFIGSTINTSGYFSQGYIFRQLRAIQYRLAFQDTKSFTALASAVINGSISQQTYVNTEPAKAVPVLVYHGIPDEADHSEINVQASVFKDQMFALKKEGYTAITTDQLYKFLRGEISLPHKSVLITFDDGRTDSFEFSDPILKALDYRATMFSIARYPFEQKNKNGYYISIEELKRMENSKRWDIQAHTFDGHANGYLISTSTYGGHFFGSKFWLPEGRLETDEEFESRIREDMEKVKYGLEKSLGKNIQSFAFPYGDYGQNHTNFSRSTEIALAAARDLFSLAFYQTAPGQRFTSNYYIPKNQNSNFFLVKRIDVNVNWTGSELVAALEKSLPKELPYMDNFSSNKGWILMWGDLSLYPDDLMLHARPADTGATMVLDGSRLWQNYTVNATVSSPNRSGVYLWTRFQSDDNNVACNFGNGFLHIEETINGEKKVSQGIRDSKIIIPAGEFKIEGTVNGRTATCTLNDTFSVTHDFLDTSLDTGGIGFKTWDETQGVTQLIIKNLEVTSI